MPDCSAVSGSRVRCAVAAGPLFRQSDSALPDHHPLALRDAIDLTELRDDTFLVGDTPWLPFTNLIRDLCLETGIAPKNRQVAYLRDESFIFVLLVDVKCSTRALIICLLLPERLIGSVYCVLSSVLGARQDVSILMTTPTLLTRSMSVPAIDYFSDSGGVFHVRFTLLIDVKSKSLHLLERAGCH